MATVSNPATLLSVYSVHAGGANLMTTFRRGGSYVRNVPNAYPNIVTTGTLSLSSFAGTISPTTYLTSNVDATDVQTDGIAAEASISLGGTLGTLLYRTGDASVTWKLAGHVADFEVYMQKNSGTTPSGSAVNTWLSLASDRSWYLAQSPTNGSKTFYGALSIRTTASPQTTLNTAGVYMYAFAAANPCPNCCFTPETLITMANGTTRAIVDIMVGELIKTRNGSKAVTEVITRTNRVMYAIHFADGRVLNASEDHPIYVVDKGYAAINPGVGGEYKDLGIPDQLYVGDLVLDSEGRENAIVDITDLDYTETVYTFAESEFYANGMLVY